MPTTQSNLHHYFRPFVRTATTVPKLFIAGILFVIILIGHILLSAISDLVKDKGEEWLFGTTRVLVTDPTTRGYLDRGLLVASAHPTTTVLVVSAVFLLLIAIASAIQVWYATTRQVGMVGERPEHQLAISPDGVRADVLDYSDWIITNTTPPEHGPDYANESVELDGHQYVNCKFHNVILRYGGRRPFHLSGCTFSGSTSFVTEPHDIQDVAEYLAEWALMKRGAPTRPLRRHRR